MRDRLIELLDAFSFTCLNTCTGKQGGCISCQREQLVDYLIKNGVIVQPCNAVCYIVDKGTPYAFVTRKHIDLLHLYEFKDLERYGYFLSQEAAEKALKQIDSI